MKKITLIFSLFLATNVLRAEPNWSVNPSAFTYSMNATTKVNVNCIDLENPSNMIGAFVGTECRGVAYTNQVVNGNYLAFLTIYSNITSGETVTFKIYNVENDTEYTAATTVLFQDGSAYGFPTAPFTVATNYGVSSMELNDSTVNENDTNAVVGFFLVDGQSDSSFSYTLISGNGDDDNSLFSITSDTLRVNGSLDYEEMSLRKIRIQGSDGSCPYQKSFTIYVIDLPEAPQDMTLSNNLLDENSGVNFEIGVFSSFDEDSPVLTYSLVSGIGDDDNVNFSIVDDKLVTLANFNYEVKSLYSIRVRVQDSDGNGEEKSFNIFIRNVNEKPIIRDTIFEVEENVELNTLIGKMTYSDVDSGDVLITYVLDENFNIADEDLLTNTLLDYESQNEYKINVVVEDKNGLNDTALVIITILDVIEFDKPLGINKVLTPNDDGKNDFLWVSNVEIYADYSLKIFNSAGRIIYEVPSNYNNSWDGKYNGEIVEQGVYYYLFQSNSDSEIIFNGSITVLR